MTHLGPIHLTEADRLAIAAISTCSPIRQFTLDVCSDAGVEAYIVMGRNRTAAICRLRELIWYRAHAEGYSLNQIGRVFGRDHTTVMHGVRNEQRRRGDVA